MFAYHRVPARALVACGVIACSGDAPTDPSTPEQPAVRVTRVEIIPKVNVVLPAAATLPFRARVLWSDGVDHEAALVFESSDGTIDSTGNFKAPRRGGTVRVIARTRDRKAADTAVVEVEPPILESLTIAPKSATIESSSRLQMAVTALWSGGSDSLPTVSWSAPPGGSVSSTGEFTAPSQAGNYRIVVAHVGGTASDTATVTVMSPRLTGLWIAPESATISAGAQYQFSATAEWSDGSTVLPQLQWSRLGAGSVTTTGRYTAPATAGTYGVVVQHSGGTLRDTAVVTVVVPPPTVTSFRLSPDTLRLQRGESAQLVATATWSDGAARAVSVSYSASGGTVSNGIYTAGQLLGTFMVIATCGCGASDTTAVVVEDPPPTVTAFRLTPDTLWLQPGESGQLTTSVTWSDGATRAVSISYSATGGSVTNGLYTAGQLAGTFMVIATCACGASDTTAAVVEEPPGQVAPWREVDFSSYASTQSLLADNTNFMTVEQIGAQHISLETDGGFGSSAKRMRYNLPVAGCNSDFSVGSMMRMPPNAQEVWVEVVSRFAPNFKAAYDGNTGCSYNTGYKYLFLVRNPARWEIQPINRPYSGTVTVGSPQGVTNTTTTVPFMSDGQWHTWRWHARYGTNGVNRMWIDGQLFYDFAGNTGSPSSTSMPFYGLALGRNSNNGYSVPTFIDWGRIRIYTSNPGW